MNGDAEVARGWLRKADADLAAAEACLGSRKALGAACFHCQQAAEKSLKAWLIAQGAGFPFVHDLRRLLGLCAPIDAAFETLQEKAERLNPYAIEVRYDAEFWPELEAAHEAMEAAKAVHRFVLARWPAPKQG